MMADSNRTLAGQKRTSMWGHREILRAHADLEPDRERDASAADLHCRERKGK